MTTDHDYVVVGAGSAGCVVAMRLAEAGHSVLVLEAGPGDGSVLIRMPAALAHPLRRDAWTWRFATGPEPGLEGRSVPHPCGRILGGSSSINGMVYVRGNRRDYDDWAAAGLGEWSYAHCLPYFRRMERFEGGASAYRGGCGPVSVITMKADHPLFETMIAAAEEAGLRYNPDYNGARQEGVHRHQANIHNGHRASASRAYLHPAVRDGNVTVETGADVHRVLFGENGQAVGVLYDHRGSLHRAMVRREVILCAGAYKSPQILLLSGIGAADALRKHGLPVVADLPAVGQNLQDHLGVGIGHRTSRAGISPAISVGTVGRGLIGARWLLTGGGIGARTFWETGAFLKSCDSLSRPDIQHEFLPVAGGLDGKSLRITDGFRYSVSLMRPASRGAVTLASADPRAAPHIVHNYLTAPGDIEALRRGVRRTIEILRQPAWDDLRGRVDGPDLSLLTEAELDTWIRRTGTTYFHPTSSCRMGRPEDAVVDSAGRVHGVHGLRVVDASVMPSVVSGNTNCPTIMLAEKLSDVILGRVLPPERQPCEP